MDSPPIEIRSEAPPSPEPRQLPAWTVPPPRRAGSPPWVHAVLLGMTAVTVTFSGSLFEGAFNDASSLGHLAWLAISQPARLATGLPFAACLLAILGAHEMGHYLACRRYGIPASLPYFIPGPPWFGTFGAVIRIRSIIPDRKALFDVAAAGPLAGFAVALPVLIVGLLRAHPSAQPPAGGDVEFGSPLVSMALERLLYGDVDLEVGSIYLAGWFGMLVTSLNLFPAGQLDGGHAAYALSRRLHRALARITIVGIVALVLVQAVLYRTVPSYLVWCVVLLIMRDRHPRLYDESMPLDPIRRAGVVLLLLIFLISFIPLPISFF